MEIILDVIHDTYIDSLRILPFLFLAYLAMECLEHWTGGRMQAIVRKSGKAGPAIGGILGIFPQCGFSAAAANLYAGRIITLGTLMAVFLSTSDEMLPIMISENVGISMIGKILLIKVLLRWRRDFSWMCCFERRRSRRSGICANGSTAIVKGASGGRLSAIHGESSYI